MDETQDLLLPYILFAEWEAPQASTGFTPFELLFGRWPQALLDVTKEAWEEHSLHFHLVIEYVQEMQACINKGFPIICSHMLNAQGE